MGVPFEALIPYAIGVVMFGITGAGLAGLRAQQNDGKPARWSLDQWDRVSDYPQSQWMTGRLTSF
ncbi:MAG: hypothetical protein Q9203_004018 [Teloschistes exilis]